MCSLGQPLPKFAVVRNFVNHCNRAITFQALQSGGRLLFIADQQHTQSFNVRHAATGCFCSGSTEALAAPAAQLFWVLWLPARLLRLSACPLWLLRLPAFIPYAKVKKLILTHYILFIWKNRCFFFPMLLFLLACYFPSSRWISLAAASLPQRPGQQLCRSAPASSSATAPPLCSRSATASRPATNLIRRRRVLRFG